ncbi:MAG: cellulase family glycosylhydrolase [Candidatus Azobacteroides sp.]|nr:cellulase family glycosylhydrolase [Candidatus Azobacteroides sp.]
MRKIQIIFFSGILLISVNGRSQGFLRSENKRIVNDHGEILLRGIGLGGWVLQEPYMLQLSGIAGTQTEIRAKITEAVGETQARVFYDHWIANGVTKRDIDSLAAWGFNSLRFPMHYNLFTLPIEQEPVQGENTWLEKGFAVTDSLLSWCKANSIYLMLDLHAAPGGQGNDIAISDASSVRLWQSGEHKYKMIALWRKIAERYADESWIGAYDIINEPNYGFQNNDDTNGCEEKLNAPLRQLMVDITDAIRTVDKKHLIVISGNCWGNNYDGIFPLWDDRLVVSFHKYWNYNTKESIEKFLQIRDRYGVALWMSESGENSNVWHNDAIRLLEKNHIGWSWWNFKKAGLNCPMEIKLPDGYEELKNYWKNGEVKPSTEKSGQIMMQLAENYKIENTVIHKDYLDALFRQVITDEVIPFRSHVARKEEPLTVYAVDYDMGRSGFAFHDNDSANYRTETKVSVSGNRGMKYRNDAVDITDCNDVVTNGYCVYHTEPGEWMQYTVQMENEGNYEIKTRIAAGEKAGAFHFTINGIPADKIPVQQNASDSWTDVNLKNVFLKEGENIIRFYIDEGGFKVNYFQMQ